MDIGGLQRLGIGSEEARSDVDKLDDTGVRD
jgi:hypothetical protein